MLLDLLDSLLKGSMFSAFPKWEKMLEFYKLDNFVQKLIFMQNLQMSLKFTSNK